MSIESEICDVVSNDNVLALLDPSYPAYIYSAVMAGRAGVRNGDGRWNNLVYIPCDWNNNFCRKYPKNMQMSYILNLPHKPTRTTLTTDQLKKWVKYAVANQSLIIYDASRRII